MRPINLIPSEQRSGSRAPLRSGPLAYVALAALVAALAGVSALVLTGNQISESRAEVATLQREDAAAAARAERLSAYTRFRDLSEQRVETVASLANSRFDWERVMRELALVLPSDVWLVNLTATATPGVTVGGAGGGGSLRAATSGPALEITGCATGQEAVAGFVTSLKDIDGVTRVGIESSQLAGKGSGAGGGGDDCRTRATFAKFDLVVAFDAAPVPITAGGEGAPPPPPAPEPGEAGAEGEPETSPTSNETEGQGG